MLAGACTFAAIADWVRDLDRAAWGRLGFTQHLPAATTVWRRLIRIDVELLSQVLARWLRARVAPNLPCPVYPPENSCQRLPIGGQG